MGSVETVFILTLAVANLTAGFGCAVFIARQLCDLNNTSEKFLSYFALLIGIYLLECVAFPVGMATQIFVIGLAFVWGIVFGLWLRDRTPVRGVLKTVLYLAFYTSIPTASFCILLPLMRLLEGGNVLSSKEGVNFGMPDFFPWPFNTILGFCIALLIGTIVLKTVIMTSEVSLLIHFVNRKED